MIRVLICDDQTVVRDGLEAILSTDDEIEVVGVARHGQEALDLAADRKPDVVLKSAGLTTVAKSMTRRERILGVTLVGARVRTGD